jgi:hypothetical protein
MAVACLLQYNYLNILRLQRKKSIEFYRPFDIQPSLDCKKRHSIQLDEPRYIQLPFWRHSCPGSVRGLHYPGKPALYPLGQQDARLAVITNFCKTSYRGLRRNFFTGIGTIQWLCPWHKALEPKELWVKQYESASQRSSRARKKKEPASSGPAPIYHPNKTESIGLDLVRQVDTFDLRSHAPTNNCTDFVIVIAI